MEVGLRTEKCDLDFKESEEEKLIKYVVQVLQLATVPSYILDGTIALLKIFCIRRPGNACYLYFDANRYHFLPFTLGKKIMLRVIRLKSSSSFWNTQRFSYFLYKNGLVHVPSNKYVFYFSCKHFLKRK